MVKFGEGRRERVENKGDGSHQQVDGCQDMLARAVLLGSLTRRGVMLLMNSRGSTRLMGFCPCDSDEAELERVMAEFRGNPRSPHSHVAQLSGKKIQVHTEIGVPQHVGMLVKLELIPLTALEAPGVRERCQQVELCITGCDKEELHGMVGDWMQYLVTEVLSKTFKNPLLMEFQREASDVFYRHLKHKLPLLRSSFCRRVIGVVNDIVQVHLIKADLFRIATQLCSKDGSLSICVQLDDGDAKNGQSEGFPTPDALTRHQTSCCYIEMLLTAGGVRRPTIQQPAGFDEGFCEFWELSVKPSQPQQVGASGSQDRSQERQLGELFDKWKMWGMKILQRCIEVTKVRASETCTYLAAVELGYQMLMSAAKDIISEVLAQAGVGEEAEAETNAASGEGEICDLSLLSKEELRARSRRILLGGTT